MQLVSVEWTGLGPNSRLDFGWNMIESVVSEVSISELELEIVLLLSFGIE